MYLFFALKRSGKLFARHGDVKPVSIVSLVVMGNEVLLKSLLNGEVIYFAHSMCGVFYCAFLFLLDLESFHVFKQ